jgi:hypothetical protein
MRHKEKKEGYKGTGFKTGYFSPSFFRAMQIPMLIVTAFLFFSAIQPHDYHVSVTQMQYNSASKVFELSVRIFTDDLEKALGATNGNRRFTVKDGDANDTFVSSYVSKNLLLSNARQEMAQLRYIGKQQEDDATWIYIEIPVQLPVKGYKLQNSILTETFDDQVNMVNITTPAGKKTYMYKKSQLVHIL